MGRRKAHLNLTKRGLGGCGGVSVAFGDKILKDFKNFEKPYRTDEPEIRSRD